ncbi:hypothetical protein FDECE_10467 [Fusarium decemcellulare]|nr:hypothetical protein FDECE_10467 [Fusarium decemcellulare]
MPIPAYSEVIVSPLPSWLVCHGANIQAITFLDTVGPMAEPQPTTAVLSRPHPSSQPEPQAILYSLEKLLNARREGKLACNKDGKIQFCASRWLLQSYVDDFQRRWPGIPWSANVLESKLHVLKAFWHVFLTTVQTAGNYYDSRNKRPVISTENQETLVNKYPQQGKRILKKGLPTNENFTFYSWEELFLERPWYDTHRFAEPVDNGALCESPSKREDAILYERHAQVDETGHRDEAEYSSCDEECEDEPTDWSYSEVYDESTSGKRRRESIIASVDRTDDSNSQKRRRTRISADGAKELLELVRPRTIMWQRIPTGSDDIRKAVKDCSKVLEPRGPIITSRVIMWICSNPMNAVTWNALGSVEIKEAFAEHEIGPLK